MLLRPVQVRTGTEPGHLPAHECYKSSRSLPSATPCLQLNEDGGINQAGLEVTALGSRAFHPTQTLSAHLGPPGVIHYH